MLTCGIQHHRLNEKTMERCNTMTDSSRIIAEIHKEYQYKLNTALAERDKDLVDSVLSCGVLKQMLWVLPIDYDEPHWDRKDSWVVLQPLESDITIEIENILIRKLGFPLRMIQVVHGIVDDIPFQFVWNKTHLDIRYKKIASNPNTETELLSLIKALGLRISDHDFRLEIDKLTAMRHKRDAVINKLTETGIAVFE